MRIALIEDELPALEQLERIVCRLRPHAQIVARLRSVRQLRSWLAQDGAACDCVLADIQLGDGLSLEAFEGSPLGLPVIFTTAYDHHLAPALAGNGIAYLLKPVREADLEQALAKVERLEQHFVGSLGALARRLASPAAPERLVGRRGRDWAAVPVDTVRWVRVRHGITTAVAADGTELMLDESLAAVESRLSPLGFARLNRWYLGTHAAIVRVRPEGRGRLALTLDPDPGEAVVVPQEQAAAFRVWFGIRG